mgnify:CR=1 FL=1
MTTTLWVSPTLLEVTSTLLLHLSITLLYKAFGWEIPTYIHVEHIMKDKQHKLSKRDGDASYEDLMKKGYLKEAL